MKKIKIIDLLNKIENEEEVPKKIKVTGTIYDFDEEYGFYFTKTKNGKVALGGKSNEINLIYNFNTDNVEIIEEEKKIPEKPRNAVFNYSSLKDINYLEGYVNDLTDTINEIIDYLESKEKGE